MTHCAFWLCFEAAAAKLADDFCIHRSFCRENKGWARPSAKKTSSVPCQLPPLCHFGSLVFAKREEEEVTIRQKRLFPPVNHGKNYTWRGGGLARFEIGFMGKRRHRSISPLFATIPCTWWHFNMGAPKLKSRPRKRERKILISKPRERSFSFPSFVQFWPFGNL